jgi:undecaprenyl-diphosphatase
MPGWVRRLDAVVGRRINARASHPAVDAGLARLSTAANRSVLWFAIAAALVVLGRGRAAARGSASLIGASILANLVGKQIFGGDRPLLKDIPVGRRLRRMPTSPSFPSGHSASAAAFATGVTLESPRVGLAIAPAAVTVAYSRLHTGAHWFSDVIGGTALGVAAGVAGKLLVPAKPTPARPVRRGGTEISLPALPDGDGALIVVNPGSGASVIRANPVERIRERLPKARLHDLTDDEDLTEALREIIRSDNKPQVLGVCGGDGTVSVVAHVAREANLPFLVIPGGTFNHFARAAGLDSVDEPIDALQAGQGVRVDVAELAVGDEDPITVLNAASVGIYPAFIAEREKREKVLGKWIAALIAAVRVVSTSDPAELDVDGRAVTVWSLVVGVNRNHDATIAPLQRNRLDDGLLDVRMMSAVSRIRAMGALAFGRRASTIARTILRLSPALEEFTTDAIRVAVRPRPGQAAGFAHDGEVWEDRPGREAPSGGYISSVRVIPAALDVYSPALPADTPNR